LSTASSASAVSERISRSIAAEKGIEFTDVPPEITPTLNVVLGEPGTCTSEMPAIALPSAWIGFGMPNAP